MFTVIPLLLPLTLQPNSLRPEPPARALPHISLEFVQPLPEHNYSKEVLTPLHKAQAAAAEKARLAALAAADAAQAAEAAHIVTTPAPSVPVAPVVSYDGNDIMAAAGAGVGDYGFIRYIISHEGHWDPCVVNGGAHDCSYAASGGQRAYGICQALPGSKMASAGVDWATNPVTQMRWCTGYAENRYGSWGGAYAAWLAQSWW